MDGYNVRSQEDTVPVTVIIMSVQWLLVHLYVMLSSIDGSKVALAILSPNIGRVMVLLL